MPDNLLSPHRANPDKSPSQAHRYTLAFHQAYIRRISPAGTPALPASHPALCSFVPAAISNALFRSAASERDTPPTHPSHAETCNSTVVDPPSPRLDAPPFMYRSAQPGIPAWCYCIGAQSLRRPPTKPPSKIARAQRAQASSSRLPPRTCAYLCICNNAFDIIISDPRSGGVARLLLRQPDPEALSFLKKEGAGCRCNMRSVS